jgi:hypothetical protein
MEVTVIPLFVLPNGRHVKQRDITVFGSQLDAGPLGLVAVDRTN